MNIKKFIKAELTGWKKQEILALLIVFSTIIINAIIFKDSIVAIISAFCGILYSTIAGKGKISCYFFGLMGTGCYSYLAFDNALYGNLLLYMGYYFPMQILGIFSWKKNLKKKTLEIKKTNLRKKEAIVLYTITILLCVIAIILLMKFNDSNPIIDGITTILSIAGMYLTVKRCIEQWIIWMIVNALSSIMWLNLILNGTKAYATLIMWLVYFILAIYFFNQWKKEINEQAITQTE